MQETVNWARKKINDWQQTFELGLGPVLDLEHVIFCRPFDCLPVVQMNGDPKHNIIRIKCPSGLALQTDLTALDLLPDSFAPSAFMF